MVQDKFIPMAGVYLLSHSVGRPPVGARTAVAQEFFGPWESGDADVWPGWLAAIDRFRAVLGALLNSEPDNFCPQANLSSALTKLLYSLQLQEGRNTLLLTEQDFPSLGFVMNKARSLGYQLKFIPNEANTRDPYLWDNYLSSDVRFALVTHVHSNTGSQVPVSEITALARKRGIISIVDIAQSVAVLPIDLQQWDADFVIGSCVKWACGGPGAGFLWAGSEIMRQCEPVDVGWFSHESPFEFDLHNFRYADGALRFWGGTPSVLPFVVATRGLQLIESIGVATIRAHNLSLTETIMEAVSDSVLVTPRDTAHRGGTVVLDFGEEQSRVVEALVRASVHFDSRPAGLRLSPHIYNSLDDVRVVLDCFPD